MPSLHNYFVSALFPYIQIKMFVTDIVSVPDSNPCGLLETQDNLVRSSHGQQRGEALTPSDTFSPILLPIHPSLPSPQLEPWTQH